VDPDRRWEMSRFYWPPTFEQVVAIGGDRKTPRFRVTDVNDQSTAERGEVVVRLRADQPKLDAMVTYRWGGAGAVLRKSVVLRNIDDHAVRVLDVRLGTYATGVKTFNGEQGHPVYADGSFFFGVAHPAGWSTGEAGEVRLHHHPGTTVAPGEKLECFESVYGVSKQGEVALAFKEYIRSRMRRVERGHDRPYAFFEAFGSDAEKDQYDAREARLMPNVAALDKFTRETNCRFDAYSIEFWEDLDGNRSEPDAKRFPRGFAAIREPLARINTALGLWMDITGPDQSIGKNPLVARTLNFDPDFGTERRTMCLATEAMAKINRDAFVRHVRDGVRLLKFDGYWAACRNNAHAHLPGIYATEAIDSAFINLLHDIDAASPECFFELYGGYHSPWWLLHADTIYESGIAMEAATPGPWPTLWARDGVTRVLDQATVFAGNDVPALGKDSLGVWLSDWRWNSCIGVERWQAGFVMDMMRGSMLAQPWCDVSKMDAAERTQLAEFIAMLRAHPACFDHTRLVLGSPWKNEPYGWCGSDGKRAFIALNNGTWQDQTVTLQFNERWSLPGGRKWKIYRRWPDAAELRGAGKTIALRPFEILLLEAVIQGEAPALGTKFEAREMPVDFAEKSREIAVQRDHETLTLEIPATAGGFIALTADVEIDGRPLMRTDAGSHWKIQATGEVNWMAVLAKQIYYRCSWQAWRAVIERSDHARKTSLKIEDDAPAGAKVSYRAYFVPR